MSFAKKGIRSKNEITLDMARRIIEAVKAEAERIGVKAVVAVCNSGARLVSVDSMDDAYIASYDIAVGKAYTCASIKMPTKALKHLSQPGADLYGIQHTNSGQIVIFGGGEPLFYNGECIGAVAVSGGSEDEDTYLGEYGLRVFEGEI